MKTLIASLVFASSLAGAQDLVCYSDTRPGDGDLNAVKFVQKPSGLFDVSFSYVEGGRTPNPHPPPILDKVVITDIHCAVSKLNNRIRFCYNRDAGDMAEVQLISTSEIEYLPNKTVSHVMRDSLQVHIGLARTIIERNDFTFSPGECVLK